MLTEDLQVKPASRRTRLAVGIAAAAVLIAGGAVRLGLTFSSSDEASESCPVISELDFTFGKYAIPEDKDSYRCRDFDKLPNGCTYWVTGFEPIISAGLEGVVHHMLLFSTDRMKSTCPYTCFDMPEAVGIDAAWAVGTGKIEWPAGMGYTIGGFKQSLQMHYNNHQQLTGLVDSQSGLRLTLTSIPPKTTITSILVGLHPLGKLSIPGRKKNVTRFVECSPRLRGNVTILAYTTHAHKLGISVISEVRHGMQKGGTFNNVVGDVGSDPYFDFNYQQVKMFPVGQERHLVPGDSVRVICGYNSLSRKGKTRGGWGSDDEMCMTMIYAYPSQNVRSTSCFSDYSYSL